MTNGTIRMMPLRIIVVLAGALALLVGLACSDQSPNIGKYYKGRILHINVAAMERADELRWTTGPRRAAAGAADQFYRLTPQDAGHELVLLRVKVENHTATTVAINVDSRAAQLRDFLQGRYFPIDVESRAEPVGVPEQPSNRCTLPVVPARPEVCVEFLWNAAYNQTQPDGTVKQVRLSQELPHGTGLDGWLVFEVPRAVQLRSFRWSAGDTISIDF